MLLGEFRCSTDDDGWLTIPSVFRPDLVEGMTVTRGIEGCLWVYPAVEWQRLAERVKRLPFTSQPARAFARFIFSGAVFCTPNQAGELLLPEHLRRYATIQDEVVVVGLLSHVEIWCPGRWRRSKLSFVEDGAALVEALSGFGI